MDGKLTEKVNRTECGYYVLQDIYRKPMSKFYEEEYYQGNVIYQKGYDKTELHIV